MVSDKQIGYDFSVDCDAIDKSDILSINNYLMAKINIFIALLSFSGSLATKCASINNKPWITRDLVLLISTELISYPFFIIILDKCNGSCNAVYHLLTKICFPSETSTFICFVFQTFATKYGAFHTVLICFPLT